MKIVRTAKSIVTNSIKRSLTIVLVKVILATGIISLITNYTFGQTVTVSGFGTLATFGPVTDATDIADILLDTSSYSPSYELPVGYKYVIDFTSSECTLYDGNSELVVTVSFKVINKKSNRDFQIEFKDPTLDGLEDTYGIIVKDAHAAHTQYNGRSVFLTVFDSMYIF